MLSLVIIKSVQVHIPSPCFVGQLNKIAHFGTFWHFISNWLIIVRIIVVWSPPTYLKDNRNSATVATGPPTNSKLLWCLRPATHKIPVCKHKIIKGGNRAILFNRLLYSQSVLSKDHSYPIHTWYYTKRYHRSYSKTKIILLSE